MTDKFGVYDTIDHCWLGVNEMNDGPRLWPEQIIARVAAEVAGAQLGYQPTRLIAKAYDGTGTKFKDEINTKMTPAEALRRKLNGEVL